MKNLLLLLRDIIKITLRGVEQIWFRLLIVRGEKSAIALNSRLDIGKKINFKKQGDFHRLVVGRYCNIESRATINTQHGEVNIGDRTDIGIGTILIGPIRIGTNSSIAQNIFITGENRLHTGTEEGLQASAEGVEIKPVVIGNGVWVGEGAKILPGVEIGDCSIIAAGSVVTKNIPAHSVAAGVPAVVIKANIAKI